MYTIEQVDEYFEGIAHKLKYVNHTIGSTDSATNKYSRFTEEEQQAGSIGGMGFPRLALSQMPNGSVNGSSSIALDRLTMSMEITDIVNKDDFAAEMRAWSATRNCIQQFIARLQKNKTDSLECDELEKYFDLRTISYELVRYVADPGIVCGTRMTFTIQSYVPNYDPAQWQA